MKATVVPAQVTTIEDRIAGSLGLSQLLLLSMPVFGGSVLYVILPPSFHGSAYKLVLIALLFALCGLLAIRIKGKIVLFWLLVLFRYYIRPRYYIYNKHSLHGRPMPSNHPADEQTDNEVVKVKPVLEPLNLTIAEVSKLQSLIANPAAKLRFNHKKGNLYVHITEVKQEG